MTRPDIAEKFGTGSWEFTPEVAEVFSEHIRASVPFYDQIQVLVAEVADWVLPPGGLLADLGASTGTTAGEILTRHPERAITAHLYDAEAAMLDKAKVILNPRVAGASNVVYYHHRRIEDGPLDHDAADLTTAIFTLQFLPLAARRAALRLAREHAVDTGALIVAEKIQLPDARWAEIANDRSHDWKAQQGISDAAIRAKARALRGVLIPQPLPTLQSLVLNAGWKHPEVLFCWHSWAVVGAFAS